MNQKEVRNRQEDRPVGEVPQYEANNSSMKKNSLAWMGTVIAVLMILVLSGCGSGKKDIGQKDINEYWKEDTFGAPLTKSDFPPPSYYTQEITHLPDPFQSWRSTKENVTAKNWDKRREEINQILQYYLTGYRPPEDGISVTVDANPSGDNSTGKQFIIHIARHGRTADLPFRLALPTAPTTKPANGWPVILWITDSASASSTSNRVLTNGLARIQIKVGDIDDGDSGNGDWWKPTMTRGIIGKLFDYNWPDGSQGTPDPALGHNVGPFVNDYADEDAPGLLINWAWGISRIIDAIVQDAALPETSRQFNLDPTKIAATGYSRWGKETLFAAAFDKRIAIANPVATAAGGAPIERFVSLTVNEADSFVDGPWDTGNVNGPWNATTTYEGPQNKSYYYLKTGTPPADDAVNAERMVLRTEALIDPDTDIDGGGGLATFRSSNHTKYAVGEAPAGQTQYVGSNIKPGYVVQWANGGWDPWPLTQGHQNLMDIRWWFAQYFNSRFKRFQSLYPLQNTQNRPNRGEWGYLSNLPFDMHYLTALVAPRTLLLLGGYRDIDSGTEGQFFNYLAVREVYRLLGAEGRVGFGAVNQPHSQSAGEVDALVTTCLSVFGGGDIPANYRPDGTAAHPDPYPINDPRSKFDYKKLNWAAPGYTPIAEQVDK